MGEVREVEGCKVVNKGSSGGRNGSRIDVHDDNEQGFKACHLLCCREPSTNVLKRVSTSTG